jgi:hypothetical protein
MSEWGDLVTVALLGTDRRPVPDGLPTAWAGLATDSSTDPTGAVLNYAARHRAAVRAGARLPSGPAPELGPVEDRPPAPLDLQQRLAEALSSGAVGAINEALAELAAAGAMAPELWAAAATLAAASPRVDRTSLAAALGVRGIWFVGRNPQWSRLAGTLQARLTGAAQ